MTGARPSRPLEGEDLGTTRWKDARRWMSIYADLLEFKRGILGRVRRDTPNLQPLALDHPNRFFTIPQILNQAWLAPAPFPEGVRNYVRRLRKILVALEIRLTPGQQAWPRLLARIPQRLSHT